MSVSSPPINTNIFNQRIMRFYYYYLSQNKNLIKLLDKNYGVDLCNVREWCWTHWGPSKELDAYHQHDLFDGVSCSNPRWCWQHDEYRTRIYLRDEPETIAFALKWF